MTGQHTTLGDYDVSTPEPAVSGKDTEEGGSGGRCIALTDDGQRCSHEQAAGHDVCHVHIPDATETLEDIVTIYSPPRELIRYQVFSAGQCRAELVSKDNRCGSSPRPFDLTCKTHWPPEEYDLCPPEPTELQWEWIESALQAHERAETET